MSFMQTSAAPSAAILGPGQCDHLRMTGERPRHLSPQEDFFGEGEFAVPFIQQPRRSPAVHAPCGDDALDMSGPRVRYIREEEIFGEGEPAKYVYQVIS